MDESPKQITNRVVKEIIDALDLFYRNQGLTTVLNALEKLDYDGKQEKQYHPLYLKLRENLRLIYDAAKTANRTGVAPLKKLIEDERSGAIAIIGKTICALHPSVGEIANKQVEAHMRNNHKKDTHEIMFQAIKKFESGHIENKIHDLSPVLDALTNFQNEMKSSYTSR